MRISDWSSDVCSSDLHDPGQGLCPERRRRTSPPQWSEICACQSLLFGFQQFALVFECLLNMPSSPATGRRSGSYSRQGGRNLAHQLRCGSPAPAFAGTRSEEHTSELPSLMRISYAVFCLKKQIKTAQ